MKKIYLSTLLLLLTTVIAYTQPYYVYQAKSTGIWNNPGNWIVSIRTDNVPKNQVIIPGGITITADNNINSIGTGDVEIQLSGNLSLTPNTIIPLTNNSTINILGYGSIIGSLSNQQILIGSVVKYDGSLDNIKQGVSVADNATSFSPNGFRSLASLPVIFEKFTASRISNARVLLTWSTSKEINNAYYEVERSSDGQAWEKIAIISPSVNSGAINNYDFTDELITLRIVYYRIRQVDLNGQSQYSWVKRSDIKTTSGDTKIYVSAKNTITVDFREINNYSAVLRLINNNGVIIREFKVEGPNTKFCINMGNLNMGVYVAQLDDNKSLLVCKKIIL